MNSFDWDPEHESRRKESMKQFEDWWERIHARAPHSPVTPIANPCMLTLSAYDFRFLRDCGVKPE